MGAWFNRGFKYYGPEMVLDVLEERIVLDASVAPNVDNHATNPTAQTSGTDVHVSADSTGTTSNGTSPAQTGSVHEAPTAVSPQKLNVVMVSSEVSELEIAATKVVDGAKVIVYDAAKDNLTTITGMLDNVVKETGQQIGNLAIVDHGSDGLIKIGADHIMSANMFKFTAAFEALAKDLAPGAQIEFFGCSIAHSADGQALIDQVASCTHTVVFASTDATGGTSSDWTLEYSSDPGAAIVPLIDVGSSSPGGPELIFSGYPPVDDLSNPNCHQYFSALDSLDVRASNTGIPGGYTSQYAEIWTFHLDVATDVIIGMQTCHPDLTHGHTGTTSNNLFIDCWLDLYSGTTTAGTRIASIDDWVGPGTNQVPDWSGNDALLAGGTTMHLAAGDYCIQATSWNDNTYNYMNGGYYLLSNVPLNTPTTGHYVAPPTVGDIPDVQRGENFGTYTYDVRSYFTGTGLAYELGSISYINGLVLGATPTINTGIVTFTSSAGSDGAVTVGVRAHAGELYTRYDPFTLTVSGYELPVADSQTVTIPYVGGTPASTTITVYGHDPGPTAHPVGQVQFAVVATDTVTHGTLTAVGTAVRDADDSTGHGVYHQVYTYTPNVGYQGTDHFSFTFSTQGGAWKGFATTGIAVGTSQDTNSSYDLALADLDGDGHLDLVAAKSNGATTPDANSNYYINNDRGSFVNGVALQYLTGSAAGDSVVVATGDLNHDGFADVVIRNGIAGATSTQADVVYLWNNTLQGFSPVAQLTKASAQSMGSIALGDFNGDGRLDIVRVHDGTGEIFLNSGDGTFPATESSTLPNMGGTYAVVATGDFNKDGAVDIFVGRSGAGEAHYVFFNDGFGSFSSINAKALPATGTGYATDCAVDDMDGDGRLDIVVARGTNTNYFYRNGGNDGFGHTDWGTPYQITTDANNSVGIGLGDVDRDGDLDVVVANNGQNVRLYTYDGTTGFTGSNLSSGTLNALSVAVGDVDDNGSIDVVVGISGARNQIFYNTGFNTGATLHHAGPANVDIRVDSLPTAYSESVTVPLGVASTFNVYGYDPDPGVHLHQFDLVPNYGVIHGTVSIGSAVDDGGGYYHAVVTYTPTAGYVGPDGFQFTFSTPGGAWRGIATSGVSIGIAGDTNATNDEAMADLNGDGYLDLVAAKTGITEYYLNNGSGVLQSGVQMYDANGTSPVNSVKVVLGDLNGDGYADAVVRTVNTLTYDLVYLWNPTTGTFNTPSQLTKTTGLTNGDIALGDFNGDGRLDLVRVHNTTGEIFLNNGDGTFPSAASSTLPGTGTGTSAVVATGDFDDDGDTDIFVGKSTNNSHYLLINNGTFTAQPLAPTPAVGAGYATDCAVGDMDGDGRTDIVVARGTSGNYFFRNLATGWTANPITADANNSMGIGVGDVDRDGDMDVVVANNGARLRLYTYNGTTGFTGGDISSGNLNALSLAVGDVDANGAIDAVVGLSAAQDQVFYNLGFNAGTTLRHADPAQVAIQVNYLMPTADSASIIVPYGATSITFNVYGYDPVPDPLHTHVPTFAVDPGSLPIHQAQALQWGTIVDDGGGHYHVPVTYFPTSGYWGPDGFRFTFSTLAGAGKGWATAGVTIGVTSDTAATNDMALADLNGDGRLDLVAAKTNITEYYLNDGHGGFQNGIQMGSSVSSVKVVLGDLNGDGYVDAVVRTANTATYTSDLVYLWNPTTNTFGTPSQLTKATGQSTGDVALGDFNGDGRLDIVRVHDRTGEIFWNIGDGTFSATYTSLPAASGGAGTVYSCVAVGDLNGDGSTDIFVGAAGGTGANYSHHIFYNDVKTDGSLAYGNFTAGGHVQDLATGNGNATECAVGDVDGDGHLDIVVARGLASSSNYFYKWTSVASGIVSWTASSMGAAATNITGIRLADVDGDGDLDALVARNGSALRPYTYNAGAFTLQTTFTGSLNALSLAVGDVDGNGTNDVVVGLTGAKDQIFYNYGSTTGGVSRHADAAEVAIQVEPITNWGFDNATPNLGWTPTETYTMSTPYPAYVSELGTFGILSSTLRPWDPLSSNALKNLPPVVHDYFNGDDQPQYSPQLLDAMYYSRWGITVPASATDHTAVILSGGLRDAKLTHDPVTITQFTSDPSIAFLELIWDMAYWNSNPGKVDGQKFDPPADVVPLGTGHQFVQVTLYDADDPTDPTTTAKYTTTIANSPESGVVSSMQHYSIEVPASGSSTDPLVTLLRGAGTHHLGVKVEVCGLDWYLDAAVDDFHIVPYRHGTFGTANLGAPAMMMAQALDTGLDTGLVATALDSGTTFTTLAADTGTSALTTLSLTSSTTTSSLSTLQSTPTSLGSSSVQEDPTLTSSLSASTDSALVETNTVPVMSVDPSLTPTTASSSTGSSASSGTTTVASGFDVVMSPDVALASLVDQGLQDTLPLDGTLAADHDSSPLTTSTVAPDLLRPDFDPRLALVLDPSETSALHVLEAYSLGLGWQQPVDIRGMDARLIAGESLVFDMDAMRVTEI
jgi:hypothetical protein